jgi:exoribonuclease-2
LYITVKEKLESPEVEKGKLIEFRLQGERRLAVMDRPEGKKDWIAIDQG